AAFAAVGAEARAGEAGRLVEADAAIVWVRHDVELRAGRGGRRTVVGFVVAEIEQRLVDEAVLVLVGAHRAPGVGAGVDDDIGAFVEAADAGVIGAGALAQIGGGVGGGRLYGRRRSQGDGGHAGEREQRRGGEAGETRYDHVGSPLLGWGEQSPPAKS